MEPTFIHLFFLSLSQFLKTTNKILTTIKLKERVYLFLYTYSSTIWIFPWSSAMSKETLQPPTATLMKFYEPLEIQTPAQNL